MIIISGGSRGGGGGSRRATPIFSGKYFKKSPKLAKIYQKILGECLKPRAPPLLQILDPPLILLIFRNSVTNWVLMYLYLM